MGEKLAQVKGLKVAYGKVEAVRDVSFELLEGEILALIGPNGSGKTSVVECLEGLRTPAGGSVRLLGCDPRQNRRRIYREVGVQLQEAEYPENIRVKELCGLFSSFYESPADWRRLLELLGLKEKANRTVKKLSGGEKQRLSVLLALLPRPRLLILDEATTGLDPEARRGIWESIRQLRRTGTAVLMVSHYLDEVACLADRLVYLENGSSAFTGTQEEFREYVRSRVPAGQWDEALSLEDVYLLLAPKTKRMDLEGWA